MIRYVGLDLPMPSSPLSPPYFTANGCRAGEPRRRHGRGVEPGRRVRGHVTPDLFLSEVKDLPSGLESTHTADYQDIAMNGDWNRCYKEFASDRVCYDDLDPGYAAFGGCVTMFLAFARNHASFLDGTPAYEAGLVNWSIGQKPKEPGLLGVADGNWPNATQTGVFSFVYPGRRRGGLRAHGALRR